MNATKFVVLLFIGVLCAKVDARKLEEVSKDTEMNLSVPKATTKGVGDELSTTVITEAYNGGSGSVFASRSPDGPTVSTVGSGSQDTRGEVEATGDNSVANASSVGRATGGANGAVSPTDATGGAGGSAEGGSNASGGTVD